MIEVFRRFVPCFQYRRFIHDQPHLDHRSRIVFISLGGAVGRDVFRAGEKSRRLEREREERARLAVLQERGRLAVQINDVVTRGVAAMVGHAEAGRAALGSQPPAVEESLRRVEHDGRDALAQMRSLLGVLRTDDGRNLVPQPSLSDVDHLPGTLSAMQQNELMDFARIRMCHAMLRFLPAIPNGTIVKQNVAVNCGIFRPSY